MKTIISILTLALASLTCHAQNTYVAKNPAGKSAPIAVDNAGAVLLSSTGNPSISVTPLVLTTGTTTITAGATYLNLTFSSNFAGSLVFTSGTITTGTMTPAASTTLTLPAGNGNYPTISAILTAGTATGLRTP